MFTTIGDYQVERTLGVGTFSTVKLGINRKTGEVVALKILHKIDSTFDREVEIMKQLKHPNIVQIKEVIPRVDKSSSCIVMEYVPNDLLKYIKNGSLTEQTASKFLRQILGALSYCHNRLIVHRDLKLENILLDANQQNIKLADFGLSRRMDPGLFLDTQCGSPHYMAPELLQLQQYIGPEVDIFSLGVILYALVSGCFPWEGDTPAQQLAHQQAGEYRPLPKVSPGCAYVIDRMLTADPKKRATLSELFDHPWVSGDGMQPHLCEEITRAFPVDKIDEEIVAQLEQLSFDQKEVVENLKNPLAKHEMSVCLYFLLLENKQHNRATTIVPVTRSNPHVPDTRVPQIRRITRKQLQRQLFSFTTNDNVTQTRKLQLDERIEQILEDLHVEFKKKVENGSPKKTKVGYHCKNTVVQCLFDLEIFEVEGEGNNSQKAIVPRFLGGDLRIYNIVMGHLNISLSQ